jgi:hypothetical protein
MLIIIVKMVTKGYLLSHDNVIKVCPLNHIRNSFGQFSYFHLFGAIHTKLDCANKCEHSHV